MNRFRKQLFRRGHPVIREATHDDVALFLYAYRYQHGKDPDNDYRELVIDSLANFDHLRVVEDNNSAFADGLAPVCI